jgi:hypothetical protein
MESLEYFKNYIERFQQLNFKDFFYIYNSLYSNCEDLRSRIEFSLLINQDNWFDLRFGLFKIYDANKIGSLFANIGYKPFNLEKILHLSKEFVPEFAVGFDFNQNNPKLKLYFLRLPDNPKFNENPIKKIIDLSNLLNINLINLNENELKNCYLLAIDFYQANKPNLKIYTRDLNIDFSQISTLLEMNNVISRYLLTFHKTFLEGELKDVTISKKYSTDLNSSQSDLSVFFELGDNLNEKIEQLIETCAPEKIEEFKKTIGVLEKISQVEYNHIGLTFPKDRINEYICLYFSPRFEGK